MTPVQAAAIPLFLQRKDVAAEAVTGRVGQGILNSNEISSVGALNQDHDMLCWERARNNISMGPNCYQPLDA